MSLPVVSGSELDTYFLCPMRHTYAHGLKLEPRMKSRALRLGAAGHSLLANYYKALDSGADHRAAVAQAESIFGWDLINVDGDPPDPDLEEFVLMLVRSYWAAYQHEATEPFYAMLVEQPHRTDFYGYSFAFTPDLLIYRQHQETGLLEVEVFDHRFLGRFYEAEILVLDEQLPRYVLALQEQGSYIKAAYRNQVLTGKAAMRPSKRVQRAEVPLTPSRLLNAQWSRDQIAHQLLVWRERPVEERLQVAPRLANPLVCRFCPFLKPCSARAEGNKHEDILEQDFVTSGYGYIAEDPFE